MSRQSRVVPIQKHMFLLVNTELVSGFPKGNIYEARQRSLTIMVNHLSYVNVWSFGFERAQITINAHFCLKN